ncbi:MAG: CapA family protein [Eggerthellaceae bacterium]|nr:CapA family protein [Eggerthellaceae bacterium]
MSNDNRKSTSQRKSVKVNTRAQGPTSALSIALKAEAAVLAVAFVIAFALPRISASPGSPQTESQASPAAQDGQAAASAERVRSTDAAVVTFVAVGDNLPNETIGLYADKKAGKEEDGKYDYTSLFQYVKPYIQAADLAYIDQETHVGGDDLGPSGYPSFNTTDEMADAVVDSGFDFVASATNHSYDWGYFGALEHSLAVWEKQPVAFTGTAVTAEQYNRIATLERNGIVFALLNYTYGVNGYTQDELPEYAVNFIDKSRISSDVERARKVADVVLVAMHWGTENLMEADEDQEDLAQFLADLDVDIVLGSHPHVIGPMKWVQNSKGSGHKTLVAYSLGNFIADHDEPYDKNVLEGMLSCEFVREQGSTDVQVENVKWTPLIFHTDANRTVFAVYPLDDYTEKLAKKNRAIDDKKDPLKWARDTTEKVVGKEWFQG